MDPELFKQGAGLPVHAAERGEAEATRLSIEEEVLRNADFRNRLQILRHQEYAGLLSFEDASHGEVAAVQMQASAEAARGIDAGQDLNQRRLPRSVLADDGVHLAAVKGHRDAAQRMSAAEAFVDVLDLEERPRGL